MRDSDWRIVWNPLGASPRVLLGFGQMMEEEHARNLEQLIDVGRSDFARSGLPVSRGNAKRRLEFSRRDEHATGAIGWDACQTAFIADPWGQKSLLQVQGRGNTPQLHTAALLSSSHEPSTGFVLPESVHHYAFRIAPRTAGLGSGIAVLGGYFYKNLTLIIDGGDDIHDGDVVLVEGVDKVPDGYYPVIRNDSFGLVIVPGGGGSSDPPPGDEDDGLEMFALRNAFPSSPIPSPPSPPNGFKTSLHREVLFTSGIPFESWNGAAWVSMAAGVHSLSGSLNRYATVGYWDGLTPDSGPRPVTYPPKTSEIRVRRVGETTTFDSIFIRVQGEGEVTFEDGVAGSYEFALTPSPASYGPEGTFDPPLKSIKPGGTVTKVTLGEDGES